MRITIDLSERTISSTNDLFHNYSCPEDALALLANELGISNPISMLDVMPYFFLHNGTVDKIIFLLPKEAAKLINVNPPYIWRAIRNNTLPTSFKNGKKYIRNIDLYNWYHHLISTNSFGNPQTYEEYKLFVDDVRIKRNKRSDEARKRISNSINKNKR